MSRWGALAPPPWAPAHPHSSSPLQPTCIIIVARLPTCMLQSTCIIIVARLPTCMLQPTCIIIVARLPTCMLQPKPALLLPLHALPPPRGTLLAAHNTPAPSPNNTPRQQSSYCRLSMTHRLSFMQLYPASGRRHPCHHCYSLPHHDSPPRWRLRAGGRTVRPRPL